MSGLGAVAVFGALREVMDFLEQRVKAGTFGYIDEKRAGPVAGPALFCWGMDARAALERIRPIFLIRQLGFFCCPCLCREDHPCRRGRHDACAFLHASPFSPRR